MAQLGRSQRAQRTRSPEGLCTPTQRSQSAYRPTRPLPPLVGLWEVSSAESLSEEESQPQAHTLKSNRKVSLYLPRGSVDMASSPATPKRLAERRHLLFPVPKHTSNISTPGSPSPRKSHMRTTSNPTPRTEPPVRLPQDRPSTPGAKMERPESKDGIGRADDLDENIQRLIRETDDAFKSVGSALADLPTLSPIPTLPAIPVTPNRPEAKKTISLTFGRPSISRDGAPQSSRNQQSNTTTSSLKSPVHTASVSKVKRTKSKKSKKTRANVASLSERVSRWTLGENVTDILKGNFLRKIEADEMLTPERLELVRASKAYQLRQTASRETLSTEGDDDSETPVDAFDLEDLPARIGSSGVDTAATPEPNQEPVPSSPPLDQPIRRDFSVPRKPTRKAPIPKRRGSLSKAEGSTSDESPAPCLSPKSPTRSAMKSQLLRPLPTIPEVFVPKAPQKQEEPQEWYSPLVEDEAIYLHSTPYTMNMCAFRHGRIFLPKPDVPQCMSIDDTMDWTAFQMAILGGAGDFISGSSDFTHRDEDGLDDLANWFGEFGFETAGELVSAGPTPVGSPKSLRPRGDSGEYSSAASSATDPDLDLPIPVAQEYPHGFWNEGRVDASRFARDKGRCGIKRWTLEGPPKKRANAVGEGSLPQSPMMELVFVGHGDEGEFVPMGYNLGHDLGDFLRWENQAMYAFGQD